MSYPEPQKMNPDVKAKWIAALRSGKYEWGRAFLRTPDSKFCCLGVLCDVYREAVGDYDWDLKDNVYSFGRAIGYLPGEVQAWAGVSSAGRLPCKIDIENEQTTDELSQVNDSNMYDFNEIADIIERYL